jgi:hypothetical protein
MATAKKRTKKAEAAPEIPAAAEVNVTRLTTEQVVALCPLKHVSYSSVSKFRTDPRAAWKRYVMHDYSGASTQNQLRGTLYHAGVEAFIDRTLMGVGPEDMWREVEMAVKDKLEEEVMKVEADQKVGGWKFQLTSAKKATDLEAAGCVIENRVTRAGKNAVYVQYSPKALMDEVLEDLKDYVASPPTVPFISAECTLQEQVTDVETGLPQLLPTKMKIDGVGYEADTKTLIIVDVKYLKDKFPTDDDGVAEIPKSYREQGTCYEGGAPFIAGMFGLEVERVAVEFHVKQRGQPGLQVVRFAVDDAMRLMWSRLVRGVIYTVSLQCILPEGVNAFLPNPETKYGDDEGWDDMMAECREAVGMAAAE